MGTRADICESLDVVDNTRWQESFTAFRSAFGFVGSSCFVKEGTNGCYSGTIGYISCQNLFSLSTSKPDIIWHPSHACVRKSCQRMQNL